MSRSWHGGKGSDSRVSNHRAYWDSALWKNKNSKILTQLEDLDPVDDTIRYVPKQKSFLFLDDIRVPQNAYLWDEKGTLQAISGISNYNWDVVRNYDQFVEYVERNGIPDVISFDNDLWDVMDEDVDEEMLRKQFTMIDWEQFEIKTGAHCAKYIVNKCKEQGRDIPEYYVHSANHVARPIIRKIMEDGRI